MKKMAVLTSGGDAPGMNTAIRSIVKTSLHYGVIPVGIRDGFEGLIHGWGKPFSYIDVENIIHLGGKVLGSARSKNFRTKEERQKAIDFLKNENVEGLVVIGGDSSFAGARALLSKSGIAIIGLPGTIHESIDKSSKANLEKEEILIKLLRESTSK